MEGLSALPEPGTAGIGSLEYGGLQNQGWRGSGSNLREPWDALMQAAFGDSVVARQMKALAALRAGDAQTAHEQTMPIAQDLASFVGNIKPVGRPSIRAYHGSPHDFDKFSMDKIGAGEGAQMYGRGLYFAENEAVAKYYRDSLSQKKLLVGGEPYNSARPDHYAANLLNNAHGDMARALREAAEVVEKMDPPTRNEWMRQSHEKMNAVIEILRSGRTPEHRIENPGRMYEVNIHADPNKFVDVDAATSPGYQLPERLRSAISDEASLTYGAPVGWDAIPGGDRQRFLKYVLGDEDLTSQLAKEGVPGIRYLDTNSRVPGVDAGTRNYVVFDDALIEILRKYGIGGILAGGAGAAGIGSLDESGL